MPPKKKEVLKPGVVLSQEARTDEECRELLKTTTDVHDKILTMKAEIDVLKSQHEDLMLEVQKEMIVRKKNQFTVGDRGSYILKPKDKPIHGMNQKYLTQCLAKKFNIDNAEDVVNEFYSEIPTEEIYVFERKIPKNANGSVESESKRRKT